MQDEMKYHWIDYLMPFPSQRLDSPFLHSKMLIMSSNERFRQKKCPINEFLSIVFSFRDQKKIQKDFFFFLCLMLRDFKTTPNTEF